MYFLRRYFLRIRGLPNIGRMAATSMAAGALVLMLASPLPAQEFRDSGQNDPAKDILIEGIGFAKLVLEIEQIGELGKYASYKRLSRILEKNLCWSGFFDLKQGNSRYCKPRAEPGRVDMRLELANTEQRGPVKVLIAAPRSRISLRMYQASVQEEVQKKYKFPGGFDKNLWVRVRLTIARDGSVRNITFLERSGNEHFDRAALLSIRRTRLPPIPDGIKGDTITQVVLFRP